MLAEWGLLQWTFAGLLVVILGTSGLFVLYTAARLFVNPGRRTSRR
ncbi:MAG: hypothetical protein ACKO8G_01240 [Actinomycetota bacterium]